MMKILRPQVWVSGPDPIRHKLYTQCQRARAQAWFRDEGWEITEEQYIELWLKDDRHLYRGRSTADLCMTRIDDEKAWSLDNIEIISRAQHYKQCSVKRGTNIRRTRKKDTANV